ncbi:MAG: aminotransferase class I/II-fold pyridoxal phosphate-dependent enzyme [Verrucomicrobiaceae bacterium]|nr:aminotransferase class I/II-fold pyridoxal phosphate-dependent enzyme [Verrucomicrobiaceae bacterium]
MNNPKRFIANHVLELPKSGIREFFAIAATMSDAISLGIGEPDFVTPWHIREAAIFAIENGKTSYTDNLGLRSLRNEIANYVGANYGIAYDASCEVLVGVGVSEVLDCVLRAIINPGDKVMYHEPCFVSYAPSIKLAHGIPVQVKTRPEDHFAFNIDEVKKSWQPGCKAILLNFPTNPTGGVAEAQQLKELAKFAQEKDMLVISDEIYSELTYDGKHVSIASFDGMKERTVFLHGFSKAFAMTGFRIGYACAPKEIIEGAMKAHQYAIMCAPIVSQEAAIEALRNGKKSMLQMREQYQNRRDFIVGKFNEMGMDCHLPKGTFYAFPSIKRFGMTSMEFAKYILNEAKVAVVPGSAFGEDGEGFVRASFSTSYDNLVEASERMKKAIDKLHV